MAYDALAESVELIRTRTVTPVPRLSRRRRFTAMSVDVGRDFAVTAFARRGVGCVLYETYVLALRTGQWSMLGGGSGGGPDEGLLDDRPQQLSAHPGAADIGSPAMVLAGSGGVLDDRGRTSWWPGAGRWISYATVSVSAEVRTVTVADRRLVVPWHGRLAVGWTGRRPPTITALDRTDCSVATLDLPVLGRSSGVPRYSG